MSLQRVSSPSWIHPRICNFNDLKLQKKKKFVLQEQDRTQQQVQQSQQESQSQASNAPISADETLAKWGKPLGLPAPIAPVSSSFSDGKKSSNLSSSPVKRPKTAANGNSSGTLAPFYVDLAYIPHHSDPKYSDVEFFKRIRARHYVLSTLEPSTQVLEALLEGKQSWTGDDQNLGKWDIRFYYVNRPF